MKNITKTNKLSYINTILAVAIIVIAIFKKDLEGCWVGLFIGYVSIMDIKWYKNINKIKSLEDEIKLLKGDKNE